MMNQTYGNSGSQDPTRQNGGSSSRSTDDLKHKATELGEDLKSRARDAGEDVRAKSEAGFDRQTDKAADKVEGIADSVRAAADQLEDGDSAQMSEYLTRAASTIDKLADSMRNKSADELMRDVRQLAVKNPGLFLAGSVAVGFGLTRFARASARGHGSARPSNNPGPGKAAGEYRSRQAGGYSGDNRGSEGMTTASGGSAASSVNGPGARSAAASASGVGAGLPRSGNPSATPSATLSSGVGNAGNSPLSQGGSNS
jgi:hypothetical protein